MPETVPFFKSEAGMSPLPKSRHGRGSSATPGEDRGSLRRSGPGEGSFHTPVGVEELYKKTRWECHVGGNLYLKCRIW